MREVADKGLELAVQGIEVGVGGTGIGYFGFRFELGDCVSSLHAFGPHWKDTYGADVRIIIRGCRRCRVGVAVPTVECKDGEVKGVGRSLPHGVVLVGSCKVIANA